MKRLLIILKHLLYWSSMPFLISFYIWAYQFTVLVPKPQRQLLDFFQIFMDYTILNSITVLIGSFGFYTMYYLIAPKFIYRSEKSKLVLSILILLFAPIFLIYLLSLLFLDIALLQESLLLSSYIIIIPFSILGALIRVWNYGKLKNRENIQLEIKNLETELNLLKTQINPHFLFNTINNIDILIENEPKTASKYLRKLGDLLRFMLYRVNRADTIPLKDEIEYLEKYIELQKIRSVNPNFVNFTVKGNLDHISIAPMIFIVFIENAFKYVADKKIDNAIKLELEVLDSKIIFSGRNSISGNTVNTDENSGIGLASVKQRLDLIYKDRHHLDIKLENNFYNVKLQINF